MDGIQSLLSVDEDGETVLNLFLGDGPGDDPPAMSRSEAEAYADAYTSTGENAKRGAVVVQGCYECRQPPAAGNKLRACGGCLQATYCSDACQRAAWSDHKRVCKTVGDSRAKLVASLQQRTAPGGVKRNLKKEREALFKWFDGALDVGHKVMFLAWKHRAESPLITVHTPSTRPGAVARVRMVPRSDWDDASKGSTGYRSKAMVTALRGHFSRRDFHADRACIVNFSVQSPTEDPGEALNDMSELGFSDYIKKVHTSVLKSLTADEYAAEYLRRQRYPDNLVTFVRLTGLVGAAHLNGVEGVLKGPARNCPERFTVHLEDGSGKDVDVKRQNYELLPRPRLVNREFQ